VVGHLVMVENLPLSILAPFIKPFDPTQTNVSVELPRGVQDRLNKPSFTQDVFPSARPSVGTLRLIATSHGDVNTVLTDDELVEREFSGQRWNQQVQGSLREGGLLQDRSKWVDASQSLVPLEGSSDGLFCVKVDNLPDEVWRDDLAQFLHDHDCRYFEKIVVPSDRREREESGIDKSRRFAFVKFTRLRWALKFVEDYQKMTYGNFILTAVLAF
jgi:hypothetical protein